MEEKCATRSEAIQKLRSKLQVLWKKYKNCENEVRDIQEEQEKEREAYLETIRELSKEIRRKMKIISFFVSSRILMKIEESAYYDDVEDQWKIANLELCGNVAQISQFRRSSLKKKRKETPKFYGYF